MMAEIPRIEKLGSPSSNGDGYDKIVTRIFQQTTGTSSQYVPKKGANSDDGYFLNYTVRTLPGWEEMTLNYTKYKKFGGNSDIKNNEENSNLSIGYDQRAIELHPNHLVKWDNELYESTKDTTPFSPSLPAWWNTAKDKSDATGINNYLWSEDIPSNFEKDGTQYIWVKVGDRTKPGVNVYDSPLVIITETKHCKRRSTANKFLVVAGSLTAPSDTYGYSSDTDKWLAKPLGISEDGEFLIASNEYNYNPDGWDTDIYGV
jgi:hypothetical protein